LHTRQFAKRQRTWFRQTSNLKYSNVADSDLLEQVWERINEFV